MDVPEPSTIHKLLELRKTPPGNTISTPNRHILQRPEESAAMEPEQKARKNIDQLLEAAGWKVQAYRELNTTKLGLAEDGNERIIDLG